MFMAAVDNSIVSTALPRIGTEFEASNEVALVFTCYVITFNAFQGKVIVRDRTYNNMDRTIESTPNWGFTFFPRSWSRNTPNRSLREDEQRLWPQAYSLCSDYVLSPRIDPFWCLSKHEHVPGMSRDHGYWSRRDLFACQHHYCRSGFDSRSWQVSRIHLSCVCHLRLGRTCDGRGVCRQGFVAMVLLDPSCIGVHYSPYHGYHAQASEAQGKHLGEDQEH